jgi:hypothetical protein
MICVNDLDETTEIINGRCLPDTSCLSISSGKTAREFKYKVRPSMVGINIGIAAPMSYFPFGGAGECMFADTEGLGWELFRFCTVNSRSSSPSIRGRPSGPWTCFLWGAARTYTWFVWYLGRMPLGRNPFLAEG